MKKSDGHLQALKLQEVGKLDEAAASFNKILRRNPKDFVSLYSIAVIRFQQNDYQKALSYFNKAVAVNPSFAQLHYNIGLILANIGKLSEAKESLEKAISLDSTNQQAVKQLEIVNSMLSAPTASISIKTYSEALYKALELQSQNRMEDAEYIFQHLLSENEKDFVSLFSMAVIEQHRGKPEKALEYVDRGVAVRPDYALLWYNRGVILQSIKQLEKAVESYDHALKIDPKHIEAMTNRGAVLVELKRHKEALLNYEELLRVDPNNAKALNNRGIILTDFKKYDIAIATFERLLQLSPEYDYALGNLAFAKMHACDWKQLQDISKLAIDGVRAGKQVCKTQPLLAITGDPADHLLCARIFGQQHCPPHEPLWNGERYDHKKIRIAYMSPDFREHPVGHLTAGIFEHHDKEQFEIIAISLGIDDNSSLRKRMLDAFDKFIDVRQMSSRNVAEMLHAMEIDIVVDLAGYTADSRTDILAFRPAPIQVNFLGYSCTMGVDYIDYIIADKHIIPEEAFDCYSEKVVYLPDTYLPTDSAVEIADRIPPRSEYGLPANGFIFCSFNHDYKINPDIFDIWMRLLALVPESVLWLMKLNEVAERNLLKEAAARGIAPERIVFATRVPKIEDHLARYRMADLFLDTTPYNAHSTTSDVLRAGLPVLTCRGKSFAGRVAAGLLMVVDLPEMITDTLEEYESLALRLALNRDLLHGIREKLQKNLESTSLYDTAQYCRNLELAYREMWQINQRGLPPEHINISNVQAKHISDVNILPTKMPPNKESVPTTIRNKLGLIQTRGIGDIIIAAPIAQYYIDMGKQVYWPVDSRFYPSVQDAFPQIRFIPIDKNETGEASMSYFYTKPLEVLKDQGCDQVYCLYSYLSGLNIVNTKLADSLKFDQYKYAVANVPFANKWNLLLSRNNDREQKLFDRLNIRKDYVLVHDYGSNYKIDIKLPDDVVSSYQIVMISELTENPFDWLMVIERASMFVCVDSCFANLAEQMNLCQRKYLYLRSGIQSTPVFINNWQFR